MGENRLDKVWKELTESDMEFYEKYLSDLTEEELQRFINENPEFLQN